MKRNSDSAQTEHFVRIKKINQEKQIVYGEVYAPNVLDTYGDFMTAEDIEVMAHRFMKLANLEDTIDTNHDENPNGSYPVESFIARDDDPDYTPGAWVLGVKIEDESIWGEIKKGNLNGYSFQALVRKLAVVVNIDMSPDVVGETEEADGHVHLFWVEFDDEGRVRRGRTSEDDGHSHEIKYGTATEKASGHAHRINLGY